MRPGHHAGAPSDTALNPRPRQPADGAREMIEEAPSRDEVDCYALAEKPQPRWPAPSYHKGSNSMRRSRA